MMDTIAAGIGGFVGSAARYALTTWVTTRFASSTLFPWGTLSVNILGSLVIGVIVGALSGIGDLPERMRVLLVVGVLGGFTTFSAFSNETFVLMRAGQGMMAFAYVVATLTAGMIAVWVGYASARSIAG